MQNTLLIGLSRQMALHRELEVVANNIANMNTTGFKGDAAMFEQYLSPVARENRFNGADRQISFVQDRGTWHNFSQGAFQPTGGALDVAIDGKAFLVVQTTGGERYTRNGSLQINSQGQLVTTEGDTVLGDNGPITFQQLDRNITISQEGRITVLEGNNEKNESLRGKLKLVSFADAQRLQKDGTNNFVAPAGTTPEPAAKTVRVIQGSIEKSNVSAIADVSRMMEITRNYSMIATMLQQQGDLRKSAIEKLAEVAS
jgi:flagellar basal-body rod protein FlgF